MTLLLTEIHRFAEPKNAFVVFAADRRITLSGQPQAEQLKIVHVDRANARLGFFGLAEMPGRKPMAEWLSQFLSREVR